MRRMSALDKIYVRVERTQAAFRKSAEDNGSPVSCPQRCGTCCVHFVPDVMPIEADRLAHFLLTEKPKLIDHFLEHRIVAEAIDTACPFWNPEKPGENCMIYSVRPLICRLFGFCSVMDKSGEPEFALCRQMSPIAGSEKRHFVGTAIMGTLFGAIPPQMGDFSREIVSLDPGDAGTRAVLTEALLPSLSRVSLVLRLAQDEAEADSEGVDFMVAG
jgi:Fe-S-cluster containining protein